MIIFWVYQKYKKYSGLHINKIFKNFTCIFNLNCCSTRSSIFGEHQGNVESKLDLKLYLPKLLNLFFISIFFRLEKYVFNFLNSSWQNFQIVYHNTLLAILAFKKHLVLSQVKRNNHERCYSIVMLTYIKCPLGVERTFSMKYWQYCFLLM